MATAVARAAKERAAFLGKALAIHSKAINFVSVKSVKYIYNPFCENTDSIREAAFQMSVNKRRVSNPACTWKTDIKSNICEPTMEVVFSNGHKALFKTKNLNTYEILQQFNNLCVVHDIKSSANKK